MAEIAERSQRLVQEFLQRQAGRRQSAWPIRSTSAGAFLEMTARLMADPARLVQAQLSLWQDYMTLWQTHRASASSAATGRVRSSSRRRATGASRTPPGTRTRSSTSSSRATSSPRAGCRGPSTQVEGLDDKTAKKVDFYTRQFVDAIAPSNFVLTNPEVLRTTIESGGENLRQRPEEPARRSRARQGPPDDQDDRHGGLQGRREHRRDAGQGRLPERPDAAHPVRAHHREGAIAGRC